MDWWIAYLDHHQTKLRHPPLHQLHHPSQLLAREINNLHWSYSTTSSTILVGKLNLLKHLSQHPFSKGSTGLVVCGNLGPHRGDKISLPHNTRQDRDPTAWVMTIIPLPPHRHHHHHHKIPSWGKPILCPLKKQRGLLPCAVSKGNNKLRITIMMPQKTHRDPPLQYGRLLPYLHRPLHNPLHRLLIYPN